MPAESSVHFFPNWAKGRTDEMALAETRVTFDRANRPAREAFQRAAWQLLTAVG